jgi:hypothetical protein
MYHGASTWCESHEGGTKQRQCDCAGWAAAPVTDAGLDVERLARAMREDALTIAAAVDDYPVGDLDDYRSEAQRIAAEYAALSRQAEKETA